MSDNTFLYGPWAGMGKRPLPVNLKRQRSYRRCWWWSGVLMLAIGFYWWVTK